MTVSKRQSQKAKHSVTTIGSSSSIAFTDSLINEKQKRTIALTKTCISLCICFIVCWSPFTIIHTWRSFRSGVLQQLHFHFLNARWVWLSQIRLSATEPERVDTDGVKGDMFSYAIWLGWLNSALNPMIYYSNIKQKKDKTKLTPDIQMSLFHLFVWATVGSLDQSKLTREFRKILAVVKWLNSNRQGPVIHPCNKLIYSAWAVRNR